MSKYNFPSQLTKQILSEDVDVEKFSKMMDELMSQSPEGELKQEALAFVGRFDMSLQNQFLSKHIGKKDDYPIFCAKQFILYKLNTEKN